MIHAVGRLTGVSLGHTTADVFYLDHLTSSPLRPGVLALMQAVALQGGNASSLHALGRRARRALAQAVLQLRQLSGTSAGEVVFCGSQSEAQTLAVQGVAGAVLRQTGRRTVVLDAATWCCAPELGPHLRQEGFDVARLEPGSVPSTMRRWLGGAEPWAAAPSPLDAAATAAVVLRCSGVTAGGVGPKPALRAWASCAQVPVLVDAGLLAGRCALSLDAWGVAALVVASAPLGGPPGLAAVVLRRQHDLLPLWGGGGQQLGRRPGTEAVALATGMGEAAAQAHAALQAEPTRLAPLVDALCAGYTPRLAPVAAVPGLAVLPIAAEQVAGALALLGAHGLMVGWAKNAAHADVVQASPVLRPGATAALLCFSLGWTTTPQDIAGARCALTHLLGKPKGLRS